MGNKYAVVYKTWWKYFLNDASELSLEGIIGGVVGASAVLLLVVFILILGCVYLQALGRRSTKTSGRKAKCLA